MGGSPFTEYALVISSLVVFVGFVALVTHVFGVLLASMVSGF
jgi:hypothetical protein